MIFALHILGENVVAGTCATVASMRVDKLLRGCIPDANAAFGGLETEATARSESAHGRPGDNGARFVALHESEN